MVIALYELRVSVEPSGIRVTKFKSPVKFTGKNYVPQNWTDDFDKEGYNYRLPARVRADEVLKVQRSGMYDKTDHVARSVYFLEGQEELAVKAVRENIAAALATMKAAMDLTFTAWETRKERP